MVLWVIIICSMPKCFCSWEYILQCFWWILFWIKCDKKRSLLQINFGTIEKSAFAYNLCDFLIIPIKSNSHFLEFVLFLFAENLKRFIWKKFNKQNKLNLFKFFWISVIWILLSNFFWEQYKKWKVEIPIPQVVIICYNVSRKFIRKENQLAYHKEFFDSPSRLW